MTKVNKEIYTGIVRYNGNHYFSGDWVKGSIVNSGNFIEDASEDMFGNKIGRVVEVFPESLALVVEDEVGEVV
jgi:hypothetical protein